MSVAPAATRPSLSTPEFLRRFLLHVLPPGFVRIRHFGILSTRNRSTLLPLCRQLIEADPPPKGCPDARREPAVKQEGVWQCPQCGGPMLRRCPACSAPFSSTFAVDCEACGGPLRKRELFGTPIRKER